MRLAALRSQPPIRVHVPAAPHTIIAHYTARLEAIAARSFAMVRPVIAELRRLQALADAEIRGDAEGDPDPEGIVRVGARAAAYEQARREKRASERERAAAQNRPHAEAEKAQLTLPLGLQNFTVLMEKRLAFYSDKLPTEGIAGEAARRMEQWQAGVNVRIMEGLGLNPIDPGSVLDDARKLWLEDNARLIVSQPRQTAMRVRAIVEEMVPGGSRWETIAKRLEDEEEIGRNRARLIARDQVQKYNADLTRLQQRAAGITHYRWMGAMDNRERPAHVALEGTVWAWDNPPIIGNPGEGIQCRCVSVPVTSESDYAKVETIGEADLADRVAALGPTQKQGPDVSAAEVKARAAREVRSEIRLANRREQVART